MIASHYSRGTSIDTKAVGMAKPLADLYQYWQSKHSGLRPPSRADINPIEMNSFLPHLTLIDVADPLNGKNRFRIRLSGTHIVEAFGSGLTGKYLDEIEFNENEAEVINACAYSALEMNSCYLTGNINKMASRDYLTFTCLWLPLTSDGRLANIILTGAVISRHP